ncbi:hypothetical protein RD055328_02690 [Companilactobacillus sp. RD055328]|uniref:hypothetical protein n=1 Tax=Companilactobacillus sp. RD055328 TaxID=2916634 RepID=UPI001FC8EAA4|nr:hypothetical protein [Companilactobacillus sp. RD055328]GKQ42346.1 hypothetical protein RD055328_02690 [Companilactobacillus sp. RD055328]
MEWLGKRTIGVILLLEIILVGVLGYSDNVNAERSALILLGVSVIFVGYLVSFFVRGDLIEAIIGERDRQKEKTIIKVVGMGIFFVGLAVLGLAAAI